MNELQRLIEKRMQIWQMLSQSLANTQACLHAVQLLDELINELQMKETEERGN